MIIRWNRKGLFAGALSVIFVTPVPTYINEIQYRPSFKQEIRHITPFKVEATGAFDSFRKHAIEVDDEEIMEILTLLANCNVLR
jgi:hypothetical protein